MNPDDFPLSMFEVDCDGSACGSGPSAGRHIHPPQNGRPAFGRVTVRDHRRTGYGPAEGNTRLVTFETTRED